MVTMHAAAAATGRVVAVVLLVTAGGCTSAPTPATPDPSPGAGPPTGVTAPLMTATPFPSRPLVPAGIPGRPRGAAPDPVVGADPLVVAQAFAADTLTWDTAIDRSPFDAQARSARWATPGYAAVLRTPLPVTGDNDFTTVAAHRGFTTVTATPNRGDALPPDELRGAARGVVLVVTGHGEGGWTAPLRTAGVYVSMTRDGPGAPWQVSAISFGNLG